MGTPCPVHGYGAPLWRLWLCPRHRLVSLLVPRAGPCTGSSLRLDFRRAHDMLRMCETGRFILLFGQRPHDASGAPRVSGHCGGGFPRVPSLASSRSRHVAWQSSFDDGEQHLPEHTDIRSIVKELREGGEGLRQPRLLWLRIHLQQDLPRPSRIDASGCSGQRFHRRHGGTRRHRLSLMQKRAIRGDVQRACVSAAAAAHHRHEAAHSYS